MAEIGRIICSTLDIESVYERFSERLRKLIHFDRMAINIIKPDSRTFSIPYVSGAEVPGRRANDSVPLAGTAAEEVIQTRSSLLMRKDDRGEFALGAAGGATVGAVAHRVVAGLLAALFGLDDLAVGGGLEGLVLGAAAGLGFGLTTRRMTGGLAAPRGRARAGTVAATAFACAVAAAGVSATGGRLGAVSLDAIVGRFAASRVELARLGRPFGE